MSATSARSTVFHPADSRGHANHGWLDSHHTFSFADYHDPERMSFGALRVLNDDVVAGGEGFGTHPHRDMEIVSLPLEGVLEHRDSLGTVARIAAGDIQVMSAGTGVRHSEYNASADAEVRFLQIWVFPRARGLEPRYDQQRIAEIPLRDGLRQIVSPSPDEDGVWVNQDAYFTLAELTPGAAATYRLHGERQGVYAFQLEGGAEVAGQVLRKRDGYGIEGAETVGLTSAEGGRTLLIEVPLAVG